MPKTIPATVIPDPTLYDIRLAMEPRADGVFIQVNHDNEQHQFNEVDLPEEAVTALHTALDAILAHIMVREEFYADAKTAVSAVSVQRVALEALKAVPKEP